MEALATSVEVRRLKVVAPDVNANWTSQACISAKASVVNTNWFEIVVPGSGLENTVRPSVNENANGTTTPLKEAGKALATSNEPDIFIAVV